MSDPERISSAEGGTSTAVRHFEASRRKAAEIAERARAISETSSEIVARGTWSEEGNLAEALRPGERGWPYTFKGTDFVPIDESYSAAVREVPPQRGDRMRTVRRAVLVDDGEGGEPWAAAYISPDGSLDIPNARGRVEMDLWSVEALLKGIEAGLPLADETAVS